MNSKEKAMNILKYNGLTEYLYEFVAEMEKYDVSCNTYLDYINALPHNNPHDAIRKLFLSVALATLVAKRNSLYP